MTSSLSYPISRRFRRPRVGDVAMLSFGMLAAASIVIRHVVGASSSGSDTITVGLVAVIAGVRGCVGRSASRSSLRWRPYLSIAVVMWGVGQVISGAELMRDAYHSPGLGDLVSLAGAPFVLIGIARGVRSDAFSRPVLRIMLDAAMMAAATSVLAWRLAIVPGELAPVDAAFGGAVLLVDGFLGALGLLVFIRRPMPATGLFAVGLVGFAIADMTATVRPDLTTGPPVFSAVVYCLAMASLATGVRFFVPEASDEHDVRRDMREASATVAITVVVVAASLIHVVAFPTTPMLPPIVFAIIAIGAFSARHVIDHRQRAEMFVRLHNEARTDPLTRVGNRFVLADLDERQRRDGVDVLVVGISGLPVFTSTFGHEEGDALVVRIATAMHRSFPSSLAVVRLESDEFALVVEPGRDLVLLSEMMRDVAERAALRSIEANARVWVSVGAASGAAAGCDIFEVVARAQRARHLAGVATRSGTRLYDDELRSRDERERLIDERLPHAIDTGRIVAHYQPIVGLSRNQVVGVEALARWTDPILGVVAPDEFIARAEATDQIDRLGAAILRQSIRMAIDLGLADRDIPVGVNVSVSQLRSSYDGRGFAGLIAACLADEGLAAGALVIEVTESMLVEEHGLAVEELRRIGALGVRIAVDDFGSGFWALGYFRWLTADIVKIDRSLVASLATDERSRAVVASIVDLSVRMGMSTVAEGTEDQQVIDVARELGVRSAQGWAYARAVPACELTQTIDRIEGRDVARYSDAGGLTAASN